MKWKESTLLQCLDKCVYSEKFGICNCILENIFFRISKTKTIDLSNIFIETEDNFVNFPVCHASKDYELLFNKRIGYWKENNGYAYGRGKLPKTDVKIIDKINATLVLKINCLLKGDHKDYSYNIEFSKLSDIKDADLPVKYIEDDSPGESEFFRYPVISDLKKGDKLCLLSKGTVTVEEVFKSLSKDNKICVVKDLNGKLISISSKLEDMEGNSLIELPYAHFKRELEIFNEDIINEAALSPFVVNSKESNLINIYWQIIDEASGYIVELYKYIPNLVGQKKLYHLKDYFVDRDSRYLAIENLVGTDFIFVVKAENRNGDIIAKSRGIKNTHPEWM